MTTATKASEFRRGWPVVLAAHLGVGLGLSPVPFYTIGMLAPELAKAFGWSFGQIMAGIPIMTLGALVGAPLAGLAADRVGARVVALTSLVLFSLGFMAFALSNGSLTLYYVTWAAMAVLGAGTLPMTWTRPVNALFDARKGLALGLALLGSGLFGAAIKPLTAWMIAAHGWRAAYVGIGLLPLLIALPVALWAFRDAEAAKPGADAPAPTGLTLGQAVRTGRFWLICAAFLPIATAIGGPIPNLENLLRTQGFGLAQIAALTPLIGLAVIGGRLGGGWLMDRFWAPAVALGLLLVSAAGCLLLAGGPHGYGATALAIILVGLAAGVEYDLLAFLAARYFGLRGYGAIYGCLYCAFAVGSGAGPVLFGALFDKSGSYDGALKLSAVLLAGGAVTLLALGRYPDHAAKAGKA